MLTLFNTLRNFVFKHLSLILIILFIMSIAPLLVISIYNWPSIDDFRFSIQTRQALSATGFPVLNVIKAAATTVSSSYYQWQGTFSAIFLMALQPNVFSARGYILVPIILLAFLIFATFYLLDTIIIKHLHLERKYLVYIGIPMLFLQIQFVPSTVQAFYWYNGAVYYTFFYSLMLLYISELIRIYFSKNKYIKSLVVSIVLAVVLGGGNFVTSLLMSLIGACFIVLSIFSHAKQSKRTVFLILPEVTLLIAFAISMVAPGNSVRQAYFTKLSPLRAIYLSIVQALTDIKNWTTPTVIIICLLLIPVMARIAKKIHLSYRLPGILLGITFLLFAAQNTPTWYAQSFVGPTRLRDIIFYSYIWALFINLTYWLGWFQKTYASSLSELRNLLKNRFHPQEIISTKTFVLSLLLVLLIVTNLSSANLSKVSSFICTSDLLSGKAAAYNKQLGERQLILDNPSIEEVKVPAITVFPKSLYLSDMSGDPQYWTNKSLAAFYNKKSVQTYSIPVVKPSDKAQTTSDEPVIFK